MGNTGKSFLWGAAGAAPALIGLSIGIFGPAPVVITIGMAIIFLPIFDGLYKLYSIETKNLKDRFNAESSSPSNTVTAKLTAPINQMPVISDIAAPVSREDLVKAISDMSPEDRDAFLKSLKQEFRPCASVNEAAVAAVTLQQGVPSMPVLKFEKKYDA